MSARNNLLISLIIFFSNLSTAFSFEHSIYIWQRDWNNYVKEALEEIAVVLDKILESAKRENINISGTQLDYDCPASQLRNYTRFIGIFKQEFPDMNPNYADKFYKDKD